MVSLLLPVIYLAFISLGLPDALLGAAWPSMYPQHGAGVTRAGGVFKINCQWSDAELGQHLNAEAKKYIADNNIQLYTINAIDKAIEIGMGKRTNTILQSAFFKLADVMPIEDAVYFMKQAAK